MVKRKKKRRIEPSTNVSSTATATLERPKKTTKKPEVKEETITAEAIADAIHAIPPSTRRKKGKRPVTTLKPTSEAGQKHLDAAIDQITTTNVVVIGESIQKNGVLTHFTCKYEENGKSKIAIYHSKNFTTTDRKKLPKIGDFMKVTGEMYDHPTKGNTFSITEYKVTAQSQALNNLTTELESQSKYDIEFYSDGSIMELILQKYTKDELITFNINEILKDLLPSKAFLARGTVNNKYFNIFVPDEQ